MTNNMSKGEILISLISGETCISPSMLMEDTKFLKEIKKLISQKINFNTVKEKMINWCNNNY